MRGKLVPIPIMGMNNQLLNDQSVDGLCDSIVNLKPKGSEQKPYWAPFEKINALKNDALTDFSYEFGMASITDAFWQVRNFVGEFSENPNGRLKRLLVLCQNESRKCIDIIDPVTWEVVKTQALPSEGTYTWSCSRLDQVTIITINKDKTPFVLYYLIDDAFIPAGWPEIPLITFSVTTEAFTTAEVEAGSTKGVVKEASDQWFMATWAFRLNDGTFVKHNAPILVKVETGTDSAILPVFTLEGYSLIENLLNEQPFWKGLIAGISVCCTIPRNDQQAVLDDGAFFQVGYWPYIDRLPEDKWPTASNPNVLTIETKSDSWPTGRKLGIDNFTHHTYSSRVLDTYNKRLLLGGRSLDFALPKVKSNATQSTVPGGVYSQYLTFDSGSGGYTYRYYLIDGTPSNSNEAWDYEVDESNHISILTPNEGRQFKAVTIVESVLGDESVTMPHGEFLPTASYAADLTTVAGKLFLSVQSTQSDQGGAILPEQIAKMRIKLEIGPIDSPADEVIYFWLYPSGTQSPFFGFSAIELETGQVSVGAKIYHRITIKTDSGTYYRIIDGNIADTDTTVVLPETIWYPDRRATLYELIVQNGLDYEVALTKQLNQHPESNYSYAILTTAEQTYTLGSSVVLTTIPDMGVNDLFQYIPNLIQASVSGNPFIFDPAASYRVGNRENDIILGFGINLKPTSQGQAGQYPVYAFSDIGVWALEQTGDPTIAFGRITPISNFNGINNPYAITNAGSVIVATDNKYIYTLQGLDSVRIDEAIANDPDYKDYLKQIRIGYHRATDYEEVIFSNPFYDYSLCYNLKYGVWYKATERFKFFFYDHPELMGLTVDNVLKDFSDKDELSPVAWSLTSRVIQYAEPYVYKRLFPSIIRMGVKQPLQESAENYLPVRIQLKGYRDDQNITYTLYDQSIKTDFLYDPRIYNQYGSMYAYRIILSGNNYHRSAQLQGFDTDVEYRYEETRRRFNCSAQYLFTLAETSISICNCPEGSGTDAYYVHTNLVGTLSEIVTHRLGKVPSVFVTDLEGYLIECGVQLMLTDGQPDTARIRLTFEELIPYKAYFN
jgi:hypothetical protein